MRDQLSTREVAQLVGRSPAAIRRLIEAGELHAERLPGVGYRIPRNAVLEFAKEVIRDESGARLSDAEVRKLVEQVLEHNEAATTG